MALPAFGPVLLQAVGDTFADSCRFIAVIWTGPTSIGDICEVRDPKTNALLFAAYTPDTTTYLGINLGPHGIGAPNGFKLVRCTAGTNVLVYLME